MMASHWEPLLFKQILRMAGALLAAQYGYADRAHLARESAD